MEELLDLTQSVLGTVDRVANGTVISVDFVVVATGTSLVTEEVDVLVGDATRLLSLSLEVLKAVCLVPASGEDVEGDLATNGEAVLKQNLESVPYIPGGMLTQ